jgi:hypothetical protein
MRNRRGARDVQCRDSGLGRGRGGFRSFPSRLHLEGREAVPELPASPEPLREVAGQLLGPLVAEIGSTNHEYGGDEPRARGAHGEREGYDDELVDKRPFRDRPDHGELPRGGQPGELLRSESQVVPHHPHGLLGRHLGEKCHVVQDRGDVVEERQKSEAGQLIPS